MTAIIPPVVEGQRLSRAALGTSITPPVRIVHLGLGAFHRAHQAWYTDRAEDAAEWGIAAFTGRSAEAADQLRPQDGLYTLIERAGAGDSATIVRSLVDTVDGADLGRLTALLAAPETAIVTSTITEAGYRLTADGLPDADDPVIRDDVEVLTARFASTAGPRSADVPVSTLARLLVGLDARRTARSGPLAIVPCDNIPDNGALVRSGLLALARETGPELADWIESTVSFVSTSVDRITPRPTAADADRAAELTGLHDVAPVVTEPFSDWILCGAFPAGRPRWETAGARFVDDIEPFERRKLWLLNGAHSLLAYAGLLAGHRTVAEAIADPALRADVLALWREAGRHLPAELLQLDHYREALLSRFANPRIEHRLEQIASDGVAKLAVRVAPVALAELAAGRSAEACARAFAAWIAARERFPLADTRSGTVRAAPGVDPLPELIAAVEPALASDTSFVESVRRLLESASPSDLPV